MFVAMYDWSLFCSPFNLAEEYRAGCFTLTFSGFHVTVTCSGMCLFLGVPWAGLRSVIVALSGHFLYPDGDWRSAYPNLVPNYLKMLSPDDKSGR